MKPLEVKRIRRQAEEHDAGAGLVVPDYEAPAEMPVQPGAPAVAADQGSMAFPSGELLGSQHAPPASNLLGSFQRLPRQQQGAVVLVAGVSFLLVLLLLIFLFGGCSGDKVGKDCEFTCPSMCCPSSSDDFCRDPLNHTDCYGCPTEPY